VFFKKEVRKIVEKELIGKVKHFYSKLRVITLKSSRVLRVGDRIRIVGGRSTDFIQRVSSIELNHEKVEEASAGELVGIKVDEVAREGYKVYLLNE
jgi:GTPase